MGRGSATSLAPGFRFHPTDEELVRYYLKRKICNQPLRFDHISAIDIYKSEPWDLPDKSKLKSRDLEWYFFSMLDKKHGNGSRTNRATEKGYWKTTGKDREIRHHSRVVGMKKTLVYHKGRAPRGERSNWVMHEYRLVDQELEKAAVAQDAFVLCRIFQKSGTGPKNGEQYGAPFIEEEWEDDDVALIPGEETLSDEGVVGENAFVDVHKCDQDLDTSCHYENTPLPLNLYYGESSNYLESENQVDSYNHVNSGQHMDLVENVEQINDIDQSIGFSEYDEKPAIGLGGVQFGSGLPYDPTFSDFPEQKEMDTKFIKDEYVAESSHNVDPVGVDYLLDDPFLATDNPSLSDEFFLEANDLSNPVEDDYFDFEEYLSSFDANEGNSQYVALNPSQTVDSENTVSDQAPLIQKMETPASRGVEQVPAGSQNLLEQDNNVASSSKQKSEATNFEDDVKYPFSKESSKMLGSYPAAHAFPSSKDATCWLHSSGQASTSVHVTAGMIRITTDSMAGNEMDCSLGKHLNINIVFSFTLPQGNASSLLPMLSLPSNKIESMFSWGVFLLMFFWVVIFPVSFKLGTTCLGTR